MAENVTKIGGNGVEVCDAEVVAPDQAALDGLNGGSTAVATRPSGAVTGGAFEGCGGMELKPSFLDIAYAVSPWNTDSKFGNGAFVLDREDQIAKQGQPIVCCSNTMCHQQTQ